ncbi:hypothetical protein [Bartonella rattaustraliani]|uniref:hypothetical protein n=1 Tax=Bartonella rattaustraliani TaxID=481139 RepID=UPI00037551A1
MSILTNSWLAHITVSRWHTFAISSRNLQRAQWWADVMEISAIIQAGSDFIMFDETLKTGCEFVTVEEVIFGNENPLVLLKMMQEKCKNTPL